MKTKLLLFLISLGLSLSAQLPFLKIVKDSASLNNFGTVAFIEKDSAFIHLVFNSNYGIGGYCDASNGSIYYVKLDKLTGQIVSTKNITSALVMQAGAACLYKNSLYIGGEMANPFMNRSAFILKFDVTTNTIVWEQDFNLNWMNAPAAPFNACKIVDMDFTADKSRVVFYGNGFTVNNFGPGAPGTFKGIADTVSGSYITANYGLSPRVRDSETKITNGGNKAHVICSNPTNNTTGIYLNTSGNNVWAFDQGAELNITGTGKNFVDRVGEHVIYLVDRAQGSTCIVSDSLNNLLVVKEFPGLHARSLAASGPHAVLSFANDIGLGRGDNIVHVKVDTLINFMAGKQMYLDTFMVADFNCASAMDTSFAYCLFSKKATQSSEMFIHKLNFTALNCNEQLFTPVMITTTINPVLASISTTGAAVQTTFTPYTFNKGLKDSLYCFSGTSSIPQADFTPTLVCAGASLSLISATSNTPTAWSWTISGGSPGFSSQQNATTVFNLPGAYNVTLAMGNQSGTTTVIKSVSVVASPTVTVNSGSICPGGSFTIVPAGAANYTIQGGSTIVAPLTNSTYTVVGTSPPGCVSAPTTASVTILPLPSFTVTSSKKGLCIGESATLTAGSTASIVWISPPNNLSTAGPSLVISPTAALVYTAIATDQNGCTYTTTYGQAIGKCTGIEVRDSDAPELFPNPVTGTLIIRLAEGVAVKTSLLQVHNMLGQELSVPVRISSANELQVDFTGVPGGAYVVSYGTTQRRIINKE